MAGTTLVAFFFTFQIIGGQLGMTLILITAALSKKVKKHPLLLSFLASWFVYSMSFCLLLYIGHQFDIQKPLSLCIVQMSMVYGSTIYIACRTPLAALALIFNIWLAAGKLHHFASSDDAEAESRERNADGLKLGEPNPEKLDFKTSPNLTSLFVIAPYIAFAIVMLYFLLGQGRDLESVDRTQGSLYCSLDENIQHAVPCTSGMVILACVALEVLTILRLLMYRRTSKMAKVTVVGDAFFWFLVRIGIFTVYAFLSPMATAEFWLKNSKTSAFPHVVQALLPTAVFLIFGTQKDLLTVWGIIPLWNRLFRRRTPSVPDHHGDDDDDDESSRAFWRRAVRNKPVGFNGLACA